MSAALAALIPRGRNDLFRCHQRFLTVRHLLLYCVDEVEMTKVFPWESWSSAECLREELRRSDTGSASMTALQSKCGIQFLPVANVVECAEHIEIVVELPGLSHEAVLLEAHDSELFICGERMLREDDAVTTYHALECSHGLFARRFVLPEDFDPQAAVARMKDGLLCIQVPRRTREQGRNRKIHIAGE